MPQTNKWQTRIWAKLWRNLWKIAGKSYSHPCVFIVGLMSPPLRSWLSYDFFWSMEYVGSDILPVEAQLPCGWETCGRNERLQTGGKRSQVTGCCGHLTWDIRAVRESCGPSIPDLAVSAKPQRGEAPSERVRPISELWANKQWF